MTRSKKPRNAPFAIDDLPISAALLLLFPLARKGRSAMQVAEASAPSKNNSQPASTVELRMRALPAQLLPYRITFPMHPLPLPDQLRR